MEERLQKIISKAGLTSRRGAERLISEGRVKVNGEIADQPGSKADPEVDRIEVDGRPLTESESLHYYMFYKPEGFLTSLKDPGGRPTIKEFLKKLPVRVFPVGRLDQDTEGLLLLTNDGDLAARLMHPKYHIPKTYRVKVKGRPSKEALRRLTTGEILLGDRPAAPALVEVVKQDSDKTWLHLTLFEGRNRQVKRMCSSINHPVLKLKRISFGPLSLGKMEKGSIRKLKPSEVTELMEAAGLIS